MVLNRESYALFLGCMIPLRLPFIESSTRAVFNRLDIEINDINGASCCPAPGIFKKIGNLSWLTIAARNLSIAERMKLDIVTLCNGCLLTLSEANMILKKDEKMKSEVNKSLSEEGLEYKGFIDVRHFIDILTEEIGVETIKSSIKNPLNNFKVASFYGCHYLSYRKRMLNFKTIPTNLEKLIEATGAENVEYDDRWACCGAGEGIRSATPSLANTIGKDKMRNITKEKINCIVDICPFCHLHLKQINDNPENKVKMKIFHYNQFLGLAMGVPSRLLGFDRNYPRAI